MHQSFWVQITSSSIIFSSYFSLQPKSVFIVLLFENNKKKDLENKNLTLKLTRPTLHTPVNFCPFRITYCEAVELHIALYTLTAEYIVMHLTTTKNKKSMTDSELENDQLHILLITHVSCLHSLLPCILYLSLFFLFSILNPYVHAACV